MSSGPEGGLEAVPHSQFLFLFLPVEASGRSCLTLFMVLLLPFMKGREVREVTVLLKMLVVGDTVV